MGCSSSRSINLNTNRKKRKIDIEKQKFNENHTKFEKLTLNEKIDLDFKTNINTDNFENCFDPIIAKYFSKFEELKFSKNDLKQTILEKAAYEIIENELEFKTW